MTNNREYQLISDETDGGWCDSNLGLREDVHWAIGVCPLENQ